MEDVVAPATAALLVALTCGAPLLAQDTLPPSQGGRVRSLGLPVRRRPYVGVSLGITRVGGADLTAHVRTGTYRDVSLPTTGLLGVVVEAYGGLTGGRGDGGGRALLRSNLLQIGAGLDYNLRTDDFGFVLSVGSPVRRGGVVGRGSELRLDVVMTRQTSLSLALNYPLRYAFRGMTRPARDHAVLSAARPPPFQNTVPDSSLEAALADLGRRALWLRRYTTPPMGDAGPPERAVARAAAPL